MIKLIATDMDGTLLDKDGKLPKDFMEILEQLDNKGVKFVVASGRPYTNLKKVFKPKSKELHYICDNGAVVVEESNISSINIINRGLVEEIIKVASEIPNVAVLLCGTKSMYHSKCSEECMEEINKYYVEKIEMEDLSKVDDEIFKISICDLRGSKENSYPGLNDKFGEGLNVVVSGSVWIDITNKDVNKGVALEKIQKDLNISYEETMVFGDFYNDIEMLQKAYYSFVMENANEDMKQYGNFIAKSNYENGVIDAIQNYVLKEIS